MALHVHLAADHRSQAAVGTDHERGPAVEQRARPLHAESACDGPVTVGQEREVEAVLLGEPLLALDRIGADPEPAGAEGGELAGQVAEVAALRGAAGGQGPGVEEQHHRSLSQLVGQADGAAVAGRQLEVGREVTRSEHAQ